MKHGEILLDKSTKLSITGESIEQVEVLYCAGAKSAIINNQETPPYIHNGNLKEFPQTIKFFIDRGYRIHIVDTHLGFGGEIIYAKLPINV